MAPASFLYCISRPFDCSIKPWFMDDCISSFLALRASFTSLIEAASKSSWLMASASPLIQFCVFSVTHSIPSIKAAMAISTNPIPNASRATCNPTAAAVACSIEPPNSFMAKLEVVTLLVNLPICASALAKYFPKPSPVFICFLKDSIPFKTFCNARSFWMLLCKSASLPKKACIPPPMAPREDKLWKVSSMVSMPWDEL